MSHKLLDSETILSAREIRFLDRNDSNYPHLTRLVMDFNLRVLQLHHEVFSHITRRYLPAPLAFVLASADYRTSGITYSPQCDSLQVLDNYARANDVDILHSVLFGDISANAG